MYVLIDNYDSFTYNLFHYFGELGADIVVYRNDAIDIDKLFGLKPEGIILSPGPATPKEAGICVETVKRAIEYAVPLMGVCLGHQCIGAAFGGNIERAPVPIHGKTSIIKHNNRGLFFNLPAEFQVTRYHSLIIANQPSFPNSLVIDAEYDGIIMGIHHANAPLFGVQFHPESIETLDLNERENWSEASKNATTVGHRLLKNFLNAAEHHNQAKNK